MVTLFVVLYLLSICATVQPLPRPTLPNPHSCGTRKWCWNIDIWPSKSNTTHLVNVIINDDNGESYADITFTPHGADCIDPLITFTYEQIDISSIYENIHIRDNNGATIQNCQGNGLADTQCSTWWTCVDQQQLGVTIIPQDSSYKISLTEGYQTDDLCGGFVTMNATLLLICQGTDAPTIDPTKTPTTNPTQPTINPTKYPTEITQLPSVSPSQYPTIITQSPTFHPTQYQCSMVNETYICTCDVFNGCQSGISCLSDIDCRVECIGYSACQWVEIQWPTNTLGTTSSIICDGTWACARILFPEPPAFEDMIFNCDEEYECLLSTIRCPLFANCHVICSAPNSCTRTEIIWSNNLVQSTLTCNNTGSGVKACLDTTKPPSYYEYLFSDIYNTSTVQALRENIQITNDFELWFQIKTNALTLNLSNYYHSILSIFDEENINTMELSINEAQNIIKLTVGDIYLTRRFYVPTDDQYHSLHFEFIENKRTIF
eukprot:285050_1